MKRQLTPVIRREGLGIDIKYLLSEIRFAGLKIKVRVANRKHYLYSISLLTLF